VSAQGLTYPHDFDLSQILALVLHRIKALFDSVRKSLISLMSGACRESVQAVGNRVAASVSGRRGPVLHKVTHSSGGEFQKNRQIMDLRGFLEADRRFFRKEVTVL
jgi:hypothetical protein